MRESDPGVRRIWTAEEVARLKRLLYARTPIPQIARMLNRTEGAVRTRASQIGISLRALKRSASREVAD